MGAERFYLRLPGSYVRLDPGRHTIGRGRAADVRIHGSDVSRLHAVLEVLEERVTIEDVSKNGLSVNGEAIEGAHTLQHGDHIEIGGVALSLYEAGAYETHGSTPATETRPHLPELERGSDLSGVTLADRYEVEAPLGEGGMGLVYRARQLGLGRTVAIKVVRPNLSDDELVTSRFSMEAMAASRLNHPNCVSVIDFGETDDGRLFLVMELVEGTSLRELLEAEGPAPTTRACHIALGTLGALGEAHAHGVVHRDIKPENILLKPQREDPELVKVLDFGLAYFLDAPRRDGQRSATFGTPAYMSPEQIRADPLDGRCDIYALGVVFFELLTGANPFADDSTIKMMLRHAHDPIPDPREHSSGADVPAEVAAVVMRALAKERAERFESAGAMQAALRHAIAR